MQITYAGFLQVLSLLLLVYKTQNIITTEPNKQLRFGFLYVMPYSIYFALIKKILVLLVHFPKKTYLKSYNARRATQKKVVFHDMLCVPSDLKGFRQRRDLVVYLWVIGMLLNVFVKECIFYGAFIFWGSLNHYV